MTTRPNTVHCVLGMLGTDVHSKGVRTIARMLSDAGIQVTYAGEHNRIDEMVEKVRASGAEFVGLSFSTSTYLDWMGRFCAAMRAADLGHVTILLGGLIHPDHEDQLRQMGVEGLFGPGAQRDEIIEFLFRTAAEKTFRDPAQHPSRQV
jgi:methylmalonyl-CoA mutase C-terminal domain/subunit